jgi:hypothetical protein
MTTDQDIIDHLKYGHLTTDSIWAHVQNHTASWYRDPDFNTIRCVQHPADDCHVVTYTITQHQQFEPTTAHLMFGLNTDDEWDLELFSECHTLSTQTQVDDLLHNAIPQFHARVRQYLISHGVIK